MGAIKGLGRGFWEGCGLGIILLAALALRLEGIQTESAWWDEVVSLQHLDAPGVVAFVQQVRVNDPPMVPLYFVLQYTWAQMFGAGLVTIRMLSVLLGLASLVLVHLLGRRMFGRVAGLVAAALMAFSLPHIYYSQEVRPYALVLALVALSAYALLEALATRRAVWWCINIVANICLMWTHLFAVLYLAAAGIFLGVALWRGDRIRWCMFWVAAHAPSVIILALWFRSMDFVALDEASYLKRFMVLSPKLAAMQFIHLCGDNASGLKPRLPVPWLSVGVLMGSVIGVLVVGAVCRVLLRSPLERQTSREDIFFLLAWMLIPALLLYAYSAAWYPSFNVRYAFYSSIPIFVLVGAAISMVRNRRLQAIVAALLLALYAINLSQYPHPWRMDWKSVAWELQQNADPKDPILVYWKSHRAPLLYASGFQSDRIGIVKDQRGLVAKSAELAAQGKTVWVVVRTDAADTVGWPPYEDLFNKYGLDYAKKCFGNVRPVLQLFRVRSPVWVAAGPSASPGTAHTP